MVLRSRTMFSLTYWLITKSIYTRWRNCWSLMWNRFLMQLKNHSTCFSTRCCWKRIHLSYILHNTLQSRDSRTYRKVTMKGITCRAIRRSRTSERHLMPSLTGWIGKVFVLSNFITVSNWLRIISNTITFHDQCIQPVLIMYSRNIDYLFQNCTQYYFLSLITHT